ncbi:DUF3857 domain-containing protein [Bernardetia sp.]|uniref:transglutaminase domain-containing protein n=1 Tax=Bernardetia sp. TaxID=1937974 RepID=UPI0025BB70AD|nr:DUF3857 domain-containing protein [Bernardetia sp.]
MKNSTLNSCKVVSYLLFSFLLFLYGVGVAQNQLLDEYRKNYKKEKAIFLFRNKEINIDFDTKKDSFKIVSKIESRIFHLRLHSQTYAQEAITYSDYTKISEIDAYSLVQTVDGVRKKQVNNFQTRDAVSDDVFYNDIKEKVFLFSNITAGTQTHLSYKEELLEPRFLGSFFFTSYIPSEKTELTVSVAENIEIGYQLFGMDTSKIRFVEKKQDNRKVYTWTLENAPKYISEKSSPNIRYYEPHLVLFIKNRTIDNEKIELSSSAKNLYDWYYPFIKEIDTIKEFPKLEYFVDELIAKDTTQYAKAKRIFDWIATQIQYIAFEDGERGFRPAHPETVCNRKYGDCKDMASTLVSMLRVAGIKAHFAWIGSRDLPYSYNQTPVPLVDNHMIVVATINGKNYFLDATGSQETFGMPSYFTQDKEALVALDAMNYEIMKVGTASYSQNVVYDSAKVKIDGTKVVVTGNLELKGFPKTTITPYLQFQDKKREREVFKRFLNPHEPTLQLQKISVLPTTREKPLQINYEYEIPNHTQSLYSEFYINLHLNPVWRNTEIEDDRKTPVSANYKFEKTQVYVLELPRGATVKYLPKNQKYESEYFGFSVEYTRSSQEIILKHSVYSNYLILPVSEYEKWNEMVKQLHQAYRQNIVLQR